MIGGDDQGAFSGQVETSAGWRKTRKFCCARSISSENSLYPKQEPALRISA
jgi:hypothetical protein